MFGFMHETESVLTFHTWSKGVSRECVFRQNHRPMEEVGIWVEAVTSRRPVIINHYEDTGWSLKGCLPGHVPVHRLMSVPLFNGEQIAGVAAAANKAVDYDESDVRQVSLLLDGMWRHIERERAEKALRNSESLAAMGRALSSVAHDINPSSRYRRICQDGAPKSPSRIKGSGKAGYRAPGNRPPGEDGKGHAGFFPAS